MRGRSRECERTRALVSAGLDSELSDFESTLLQAHLRVCDACRSFASDTTAFTAELRSAVLEQLERPVEVQPLVRRRLPEPLRVSIAALAVAAVALGSLFASLRSQGVLNAAAVRPASSSDVLKEVREIRAARRNLDRAQQRSRERAQVRPVNIHRPGPQQ